MNPLLKCQRSCKIFAKPFEAQKADPEICFLRWKRHLCMGPGGCRPRKGTPLCVALSICGLLLFFFKNNYGL